jgi:Flp pilus assembly protein protease CpaA
MFELLYILLAVIGAGAAGWNDLKTTDIPDWITGGMIVVGLTLHGVESVLLGTADPLFYSFIVGAAFAIIGIIMYYSGMWGGGDGLLLTGIGVLLPDFSGYIGWMPFSLAYFINVLTIGAVYSIVYMFYVALKNNDLRKKFLDGLKKNYLGLGGIILGVIFLGYSFSIGLNWFLIFGGILFFGMPIIYPLSKIVEGGFYREIDTKNLEEGDMVGENIPELEIGKLKIRGITKEEVKKIRELRKSIFIRDGIRYGPVFLLALLFTLLMGFPSL